MTARIVPDYRDLAVPLAGERSRGHSSALANGCFDVLHVGHVRLVADARAQADVLVVALNTDASVVRNKGEGRPLVPLEERMELVAALDGVDYVTSFGELTAGPLLEALRPDVHVKGTDWTPETVPERDIVLGYGGRIAICGDPKAHASTDLIRQLTARSGSDGTVRIRKVDAHSNQRRLLDFFESHRFAGVRNAQRVFSQGACDLWFAEDGLRLVGALLSVEEIRRDGDGQLRGGVENCLVEEGRRRHGIARRLMEAAEAHYRSRGLVGMQFAVRRRFEPNEALFEAGYEVVREYKTDKYDWDGNLLKDQERYVIRKDFEPRSDS